MKISDQEGFLILEKEMETFYKVLNHLIFNNVKRIITYSSEGIQVEHKFSREEILEEIIVLEKLRRIKNENRKILYSRISC